MIGVWSILETKKKEIVKTLPYRGTVSGFNWDDYVTTADAKIDKGQISCQ